MNYFIHKTKYPDDILVYIEEFNRQDGTVLFDFIDSNEYNSFTNLLNIEDDAKKPTMVLLRNYKKRRIQENTIYSIKIETFLILNEQGIFILQDIDSFLIRYIINVSQTENEIFNESVSLNDQIDNSYLNYYMYSRGNVNDFDFQNQGKISVNVRNVEQANWNEISFGNEVKVVYDAGAPTNASKSDVINIIGDRNSLYSVSKPILVLSHWDKDHYHSLLGMSDNDLKNNFSSFICRDYTPNLTSRILFGRISKVIGLVNIYAIQAEPRNTRGGPTYFTPLMPVNSQIRIYNAQRHKNRNISGIILSVKTETGSVILSGDSHYEQIYRDILPHLNYKHTHHLIVPHHGGKAGVCDYNIPMLVSVGKAIISVGINKYGHPFVSYIDMLRSKGFNVQKTITLKKDIIISL